MLLKFIPSTVSSLLSTQLSSLSAQPSILSTKLYSEPPLSCERTIITICTEGDHVCDLTGLVRTLPRHMQITEAEPRTQGQATVKILDTRFSYQLFSLGHKQNN